MTTLYQTEKVHTMTSAPVTKASASHVHVDQSISESSLDACVNYSLKWHENAAEYLQIRGGGGGGGETFYV